MHPDRRGAGGAWAADPAIGAAAAADGPKQRIGVGDLEIAFTDTGAQAQDARPAILLLHGAVQTRRIWAAQIAALAPTHRVIAPDLRWHGETPSGTHRPTMEQFAADALGLLDALGVHRASVCGVSLGGMIALEMASRAPERIATLVLANTPTALTSHAWLRWLIDRLDPQELLPPTLRLLGGAATARIGLALASRMVGPHWVGATARRHFIAGFRRMTPEAIAATYTVIVEARPVDAARVRCPTLLLAGRRDAPSILAQTEGLAGELPRARVETIAVGHVAPLDDPAAFNRIVRRFLEREGA